MSKIRKEKISCPECGAEGEFTLWESVNAQLNPEAAEKVKTGELFSWTCPKCGMTFTVPYAMLYHDMDRAMMIYLLPDVPSIQEAIPFDTSIFKENYTYRSVRDIDDLREKISILGDELDDRAVELVKYIYTHQQRPKEIPEDTVLRYIGKIDGRGMMLQCVHETLADHPTMLVPFEMYHNMMEDGLHEQVFSQKTEFPEVTQDYLCTVMKG